MLCVFEPNGQYVKWKHWHRATTDCGPDQAQYADEQVIYSKMRKCDPNEDIVSTLLPFFKQKL